MKNVAYLKYVLPILLLCSFAGNAFATQYSKNLIYSKMLDFNIRNGSQCEYDLDDPTTDTFENGIDVNLNVVMQNNQSDYVTYWFEVSWYNPDGDKITEWESSVGESIGPGETLCWSFSFYNYDLCPGQWSVRLRVKEYMAGSNRTNWQTAIDEDDSIARFTIVQDRPDVRNLSFSNNNPKPGETISCSATVEDAATYNYYWSDNGAGGVFSPPSGNNQDSCPEDRQITTNYTVPNSPSQQIEIVFSASNSSGSDSIDEYINVKSLCNLTTLPSPSNAGAITKDKDAPYYNGDVISLTANPTEGWQFVSWSGPVSNASSNPTTVTLDSDKTVTANFAPIEVSLSTSVTPVGGGTVVPSRPSPYYWGDVIDITTIASPNYEFVRWEIDASGTNESTSVTLDGSKTVRAVFQLVYHDYNVTIDPSGAGSVAPPSGQYQHDTVISPLATPAANYEFDYWSGDIDEAASSVSQISLTMNRERNLTAHFKPLYTLTITSSDNGNVVTNPAGGVYSDGDIVTLTASPNSGYSFDYWTGFVANAATNPTTVIMDQNKTVEAHYKAIASRLVLTPQSQTVSHADTFTVYLEVSDVDNLYGHELDIAFEPSNFTVESVIQGSFLSENGTVSTYWQPPQIDNVVGRISNIVCARLTPGVGVSGSGILAEIVLREKSVTSMAYTDNIQHVESEFKLSDPSANSLPVSGFDNCIIQVLFAESYTISTSVEPAESGTIQLNPNEASYEAGSSVSLAAVPSNSDWVFDHWAGDITGINSEVPIVVSDNMNIQAVFVPAQYEIASTSLGNGVISPEGITVDLNDDITFTVSPDTGYRIGEWYLDGNSVQTGLKNYSLLNVKDEHLVEVSFEPIEFSYIDFNSDYYIDMADFSIFAISWLNSNCVGPEFCEGLDIDHSGDVNIDDLQILSEYWLEGIQQPDQDKQYEISGDWQMFDVAGPSARDGFDIVFDSYNNNIVLFGGYSETEGYMNDTWIWDGSQWYEVQTTVQPSPRNRYAMTYDSKRHVVLLLGGYSSNSDPFLSDLWQWDGSSWSQVASFSIPAARSDACLEYDLVNDCLILTGGYNHTNSFLSDSWRYKNNQWTEIIDTRPSTRYLAASAYDTENDMALIFGGDYGSWHQRNDLWRWNGSWQEISLLTKPSSRSRHDITYVPGVGLLLLGGRTGETRLVKDFWCFDGEKWNDISSQYNLPNAVQKYRTCFTPSGVLFFGGTISISEASSRVNETWLLPLNGIE